jgi:uncharacterized protein (TIGR00251 family)
VTVRVNVRAHPNARKEEVRLVGHRSLEVWVRAPAQDGRANEAIERALSTSLGLRRSAVEIQRGATGREKVVVLTDVDDSVLEGLRRGDSD